MQKLLNGERKATPLQIILASAALLVGLAVLFFLADARHIATTASNNEKALRVTILKRCQQRLAYDTRFVQKSKDDAATWRSLYESSKETVIPPGTPQKTIDGFHKQQAIILKAAESAEKIAKQGVLGNCNAYLAK